MTENCLKVRYNNIVHTSRFYLMEKNENVLDIINVIVNNIYEGRLWWYLVFGFGFMDKSLFCLK